MKHLTTLMAIMLMAIMTMAQDPGLTDSGKPLESFTANNENNGDLPIGLFGSHTNSLTTTFSTNNSFAGNMFDVEVIGGQMVTIEGFAVNLEDAASTISVYVRDGSYVGFESTPTGWTLAGTATGVVPQGANNPTPVDIGGIVLQPGMVYGFYITVTSYPSASMLYTNGANVYSDDHLQITAGIGKGSPDFTGGTFYPRIWNGTIYYTTGESVPFRGWAFWVIGGLITMFILLRSRRALKA
jgi:hypothetical protein